MSDNSDNDPLWQYREFIERYVWALEPFSQCHIRLAQLHWLRYFCSDCIKYTTIFEFNPKAVLLVSEHKSTTPEDISRLKARAKQAVSVFLGDYDDLNPLFVVRICGLLEDSVRRFLLSWFGRDKTLLEHQVVKDLIKQIDKRNGIHGAKKVTVDQIVKELENEYARGKKGVNRFDKQLSALGIINRNIDNEVRNGIAELFEVRHKISHAGARASSDFARTYPHLMRLLPADLDNLDRPEFLPQEITVSTDRLELYFSSAMSYIQSAERRVRDYLQIPDKIT